MGETQVDECARAPHGGQEEKEKEEEEEEEEELDTVSKAPRTCRRCLLRSG
jgi:hypothetical protein